MIAVGAVFALIVSCAAVCTVVPTENVEKTPTPHEPTTSSAAALLPNGNDEWRGVWISYREVAALLKPTPAETKTAVNAALDRCQSFGVNTVFFHVHANSDAYYPSAVFPPVAAVKTLTKQGFDPLAYVVSAAHSRGLTLHAWLNPYRVGDGKNAVCADTFSCGGKVYYSPASETVKKTLLAGIAELLERYDVDGIHFDDYFYPSGVPKTPQSYDRGYTEKDGSLADWRRAQVSDLVRRTYALTHEKKPGATFGISPAGNPKTDRDRLYADVERWLKTPGFVDYLCPQLYYGFENGTLPFAKTVALWNGFARASGVKLYGGLAVYKAGLRADVWAGDGETEWLYGGDILARQVQTLRETPGISGFALFGYRYLTAAGFDTAADPAVVKRELAALKETITA